MATSKTLTPTNVTIQIPAFADKPDQRVNSNCIDKEADAINALSDQIATLNSKTGIFTIEATGVGITASRCDVFFPLTGMKTGSTITINSLGITNLWSGAEGKNHASVIAIYNTGVCIRLTDSTNNPFVSGKAYYCSANITIS